METRSRDDCCTTMFALLVAVVLLLIVIVSGRAQEAGLVEDSLTTPMLAQTNTPPKKTAPEPQTPGGAWRSPVANTASVR